ncbi:MAG TPA: choice-of-anchor tandem repeat GloVer-containing protein, partial [Chthonomonadaceae bacterium]|nr:choice-of-anchor tandem repeat GloVer-containing protein [Chthonomonadaceae bacterium]
LYGDGTVFKIAPSGAYTLLHTFSGPDGSSPVAALIQGSDGNFYSTTEFGGANNTGTIFKMTPTGALTTLYSFSAYNNAKNTDGASPIAPLIQGSDGSFYGVAYGGGTYGGGTFFKITSAGALTTLYSFYFPVAGGPAGGLVQGSDGNFYGTTRFVATNFTGTVFKITPTGAFTLLHTFSGADGTQPEAALVQGPDGNFYGATTEGGAANAGTVFQITPSGTLTTLHVFDGVDGVSPQGNLILGPDGNFYSTTTWGGWDYGAAYGGAGAGTVYKISAAGAFASLYSFSIGINAEGANPSGKLIQGSDGDFYGVTQIGGDLGFGVLFKIRPGGTLTTLHAFDGADGNDPNAALVQGSDGNFYGTTGAGGANGQGTIFRISPSGVLVTLHAFAPATTSSLLAVTNADGARLGAPLVQGSDGSFYGVAASGGVNSTGTVFKITPNGAFTLLHTFSAYGMGQANSDGANPVGLALGSDGNLYGVTEIGGTNGDGTIFKITPAGAFTTLHLFNGPDGAYPSAALTLGPDGDFYGVTLGGGATGSGTVFKITPAGALTTLCSFPGIGMNGTEPNSALALGPDGNFYGTTVYGNAPYTGGTVFKVTPSGILSTLYAFPGPPPGGANNPLSLQYPQPVPQGVTFGSDGYLYGLTYSGGESPGDNGYGTVFRLSRAMLLLQNPTTGHLATWFWNVNYQVGGSFLYPGQNPAWNAVATGDFNTDGQPDILFQNPSTGQLAIWYMGNNYQMRGAFVYPTQNPAWKAVGVADFNTDGQLDILFQNPKTGQLALWYMNSNYQASAAFVYPIQNPAWKVVGVADFNMDGHPDVLFQNLSTGQLAIWYMNNNYQASAAFVYPSQNPAWQAIGIADVNWDGKPDILFQNTRTGKLAVWDMDNNYAIGGAFLSPQLPSGWKVVTTH